jgi:hypothetical protein
LVSYVSPSDQTVAYASELARKLAFRKTSGVTKRTINNHLLANLNASFDCGAALKSLDFKSYEHAQVAADLASRRSELTKEPLKSGT